MSLVCLKERAKVEIENTRKDIETLISQLELNRDTIANNIRMIEDNEMRSQPGTLSVLIKHYGRAKQRLADCVDVLKRHVEVHLRSEAAMDTQDDVRNDEVEGLYDLELQLIDIEGDDSDYDDPQSHAIC